MKSLEDLEHAFERGLAAWEKEIVDEQAGQMGQKVVREVKKLTPVFSGNLRRRWFCKIEYKKGQVVLHIFNDAEYAEAVNNGHRLVRNGKTVGKVKGKRMLEIGIETYKKNYMQKDVETMLDKLKKAMK